MVPALEFLLGETTTWTTGSILTIDGGYSLT
jgi:hypothetical protein